MPARSRAVTFHLDLRPARSGASSAPSAPPGDYVLHITSAAAGRRSPRSSRRLHSCAARGRRRASPSQAPQRLRARSHSPRRQRHELWARFEFRAQPHAGPRSPWSGPDGRAVAGASREAELPCDIFAARSAGPRGRVSIFACSVPTASSLMRTSVASWLTAPPDEAAVEREAPAPSTLSERRLAFWARGDLRGCVGDGWRKKTATPDGPQRRRRDTRPRRATPAISKSHPVRTLPPASEPPPRPSTAPQPRSDSSIG